MNQAIFRLLALGLFLLGLSRAQLVAQNYHSPAELLKIMDESSLSYTISAYTGPHILPELGEPNSHFVYQSSGPDGLAAAIYELPESLKQAFEQAEKAFLGKNWTAARKGYAEILAQAPQFAVAANYIGQCWFFEGDFPNAKASLEQAIALNFHDYLAHWYLAQTLLELKEKDQAAKEIALAWVLNRTEPKLKDAVAQVFKATGRKFWDFEFDPQFLLEQTDSEVHIQFREEWMMYAFSKAIWRFEPGYAGQFGGSSAFNMPEEKECIANLIMGHEAVNGKKKSLDIGINAAIKALEMGRMNAFIFMEIWLREEPLIAFSQGREGIEEIADYVLSVRCR